MNGLYKLAGLGLGATLVAAASGCACCERVAKANVEVKHEETLVAQAPPTLDAKVGECWAQVYVPPKTETTTDRICIKPESERLEIVPARFEWTEEQVLVKPASKRLVEVPAEFRTEDQTVEVQPGYRTWVTSNGDQCRTEDGKPIYQNRVFCLVDQPPLTKTMKVERLEQRACVREIEEPAEYQTVRVQKCVEPASTRCVKVPAEYDEVQKTVVVAPGRIEWQRTVCDIEHNDKISQVKRALAARGYEPGTVDTQSTDESFWVALRQYQTDNALGVGALTSETMQSLGLASAR
jgi:hypothetical protein